MNQQIPADRVAGVQITLPAYQAMVQYLADRPYREVAQIMGLLQTNKIIMRDEPPVDAPPEEALKSETPPAPPAPPAAEEHNDEHENRQRLQPESDGTVQGRHEDGNQ